MGKALEDFELLMSQIDEAMRMTDNFQIEIDRMETQLADNKLNEDFQAKSNEVENKKNDKKEFDEMTINALKKAYADLGKVKEKELEEFKAEYDHRKELQEARRERLAEYAKEFTKKPEESERIARLIAMTESKIKEEEKNMQDFLREMGSKQARFDSMYKEYENNIMEYAEKLGAKADVIKEVEKKKDSTKDTEKKGAVEGATPNKASEGTEPKKETTETKKAEKEVSPKPGTIGVVAGNKELANNDTEGNKTGQEQGDQTKDEPEEMDLETLRSEELKLLNDMVSISSIRFSAEKNAYIYEGINKEGKEQNGVVKALNRNERKEIKNEVRFGYKRKIDPNIFRIFNSISVIDEKGKDISSEEWPQEYHNYLEALSNKTEMKGTKILYDFRENDDKKLGFFEKIRAHRDARHAKAFATIVDNKGYATFKGQEIELLEKGHGKLPIDNKKKMDIRIGKDPTKDALESLKAHMEDPARNVKNYDEQSK